MSDSAIDFCVGDLVTTSSRIGIVLEKWNEKNNERGRKSRGIQLKILWNKFSENSHKIDVYSEKLIMQLVKNNGIDYLDY